MNGQGERNAVNGDGASPDRLVSCVGCGAILAVYTTGDRVPDPAHECPCPVCDGSGEVWEYTGHGEPVKAPCHRCGSQMSLPSEEEVNRMEGHHVA